MPGTGCQTIQLTNLLMLVLLSKACPNPNLDKMNTVSSNMLSKWEVQEFPGLCQLAPVAKPIHHSAGRFSHGFFGHLKTSRAKIILDSSKTLQNLLLPYSNTPLVSTQLSKTSLLSHYFLLPLTFYA